VNWREYVFAGTLCLGISVLFGIAPALHIARGGTGEGLSARERGMAVGPAARRGTDALVVGQLALTVVLLGGAGLMARSLWAVYQAASVIDTSHLLSVQVALMAQQAYGQPTRSRRFTDASMSNSRPNGCSTP
jgi:hypothetical protein